jgi:hypothetical protein
MTIGHAHARRLPARAALALLAIAITTAPSGAQPERAARPIEGRIADRAVALRGTAATDLRVRVPVERAVAASARLELFARRAGALEPASDRITRGADGTASLDLERGTAYVLRAEAGGAAAQPLTRDGIVLPDRLIYCPTAAEHPGADPPIRTFAIVLAIEQDPVPWDAEARVHRSTLIAGIEEIAAAPAPGRAVPAMPALDPPIAVRFTSSGASVEPTTIAIAQAGVAGQQTARLVVDRTEANAPTVTAMSDLGRAVVTFALGAEDNQLTITPSRSTIDGLGLGTTNITVTRTGDTGRPLEVTLRTDGRGGRIAGAVTIPAGANTAATELRSSGIGAIVITAVAAGAVPSTPVTVAFAWPIAWMIATFLGATLGGLAAWVQERYLRTKTAKRTKVRLAAPLWWPRVFGGLVAGVALESALALGLYQVGLLAIATTALGAFLFALIGGWIGLAILDFLRRILGLVPAESGAKSPPPRRS